MLNKRALIIAGGAFLGLLLIIIALTSVGKTTITIETTGGSNQDYTYEILDQSNQEVDKIVTKDATLKKKVSSGSYEVTVTQNDRSFFAVINTEKDVNTTLKAPLKTERLRSFVGINPGNCVDLLQGHVLISHGCGENLIQLQTLHIPGTASSPTYISRFQTPSLGKFESNTITKEGDLALFGLAAPGRTEDEGSPDYNHTIYTYQTGPGGTIQTKASAALTDLKQDRGYTIEQYKDGFIAFDSAFESIWYYPSMRAKPTQINLEGAKAKGVFKDGISVNNSGEIAAVYSPRIESSEEGGYTEEAGTETEVVIYRDGRSIHRTYTDQYAQIKLCGQNRICMVNNTQKTMEIRDTASGNIVFTLPEVSAFVGYDKGVIAVKEKSVVSLDTTTLQGFTEYTFGDNNFCGIKQADNGYVLCITNTRNKRQALYIDQTKEDNTGAIDAKINVLNGEPIIHDLNIYGQYLFVTPVGNLVYDTASNSYLPDPSGTAKVNESVNAVLDKAGIDRKLFQITIYPPTPE